jgi:hypothetical protein
LLSTVESSKKKNIQLYEKNKPAYRIKRIMNTHQKADGSEENAHQQGENECE